MDSLALCNAQINLKRAFENRRKNSKHFGKPRFKCKKNNQKGSVRLEGGKIKLPKVILGLDYSMREIFIASTSELIILNIIDKRKRDCGVCKGKKSVMFGVRL